MLESEYQALLIKKIEKLLPGCWVQKNDANYQQGIPDLTIYHGPKWAMLEVKASEKSKERPNQRYYVEKWAKVTFCAFIYPENEEEVLNALQEALRS
jgi:hypothetical protein